MPRASCRTRHLPGARQAGLCTHAASHPTRPPTWPLSRPAAQVGRIEALHQQQEQAALQRWDQRMRLRTATLASLRRTFGRVFFVPGNHDLWLRAESTDISGEQLDAR